MAGILIQKDAQNLIFKDVTAAQRLVWAQDYTIYDVNADGSKGAAYGPTIGRSAEGAVTVNDLGALEKGPAGVAIPWAAQAQALVSEAGNITAAELATTTGTLGQTVRLSDGPDKGAILMWSTPAGSTTPTWCWWLWPQAAY